MCGMSYWSEVTSTFPVSPVIAREGSAGGCCAVNVTVAVCPGTLAVTVAGEGSGGTGGRYTTERPLVPEIDPGPLSDQVRSLVSDAGLAVIVTGPETVCAPEGVMLKVGGVSLPPQPARIRDTAANIRVRIDVSAKIWAVKNVGHSPFPWKSPAVNCWRTISRWIPPFRLDPAARSRIARGQSLPW